MWQFENSNIDSVQVGCGMEPVILSRTHQRSQKAEFHMQSVRPACSETWNRGAAERESMLMNILLALAAHLMTITKLAQVLLTAHRCFSPILCCPSCSFM